MGTQPSQKFNRSLIAPCRAGFLVSEWVAGSAQIGPGSHSILKVRWDAAQTSEGWSGGLIRLRLAQPVDGQTELTIPILQRFP